MHSVSDKSNEHALDLSYWDNAEWLTAPEFVALAVGFHPVWRPHHDWLGWDVEGRREHLMRLIEEAYATALRWSERLIQRAEQLGFGDMLAAYFLGLESPPVNGELPQRFDVWASNLGVPVGRCGLLFTKELQDGFRVGGPFALKDRTSRISSLMSALTNFTKQPEPAQFRRSHCIAWLNHIGWRSEYFDTPSGESSIVNSAPSSNAAEPVCRWPWGSHETELLRVLEKVTKKWWLNYDPNDPSTAPTNEQVAKWIEDNKLASGNIAKAMATILRADGLPSGPRR